MSPFFRRVVSLLPATTETVCVLGAENQLVGISHECDYPASIRNRTIVTRPRLDVRGSSRDIHRSISVIIQDALSIYEIDESCLAILKPDLILTQDLCKVCAVSLQDLTSAIARLSRNEGIQILSLSPIRLEDVLSDIVRIADALDVSEKGQAVRAELQTRIEAIAQRAFLLRPKPKVASIEWLEPLMLGGTWMPELIALAGGIPVGVNTGQHAPTIAREQLMELRPDVIIIKPCGFSLERTIRERSFIEREIIGVHLPEARVYVTDGNAFFNRPGPRIVESLEIMAACIHPNEFRDFAAKHSSVIESVTRPSENLFHSHRRTWFL